MNKTFTALLPLILLAALSLPAAAQDEGSDSPEETTNTSATNTAAPEKPAVQKPEEKKPAPKKKAAKTTKKAKKKKKTAPAMSDYKFPSTDSVPTYKFDKKANPIMKPAKKSPASKKPGASVKSAQPVKKLAPSKPIGEENTEQPAQTPPEGE